jgi:lipopolysaccharide biosynthesis glycosyltransferase
MKIGYIIDDGFSIPCGVSLFSLLFNNQHLDNIDFFILDDGISDINKERLINISNQFNRKLDFIDVCNVKTILADTTSYNWHGSYSTYIRLMLNSLFPDSKETIVMIDADTIIDGQIDELYNFDLKGNPCAMALEAMPISYYKHSRLGLHELINGGLLIVDLEKWKEFGVEKKIIDFLINVRSKNMLTDEDVLSAVLKGKITRIPLYFNYLTQYYWYTCEFYYKFFGWNKLSDFDAFYSLSEMLEAKDKVVIYHCIDGFTNRPWHRNNIHPYTKLYDKYLQKTPWKNEDKQIRLNSFTTKVEIFIRKILPNVLSDFYYACAVRLYYGIRAKMYYKNS